MGQSILDDLERSLAALLRSLADRGIVGDVADRCGYDLSPVSWSLLEHLDAQGPLRVSDIAACHGVDISSVSPRLKKLEDERLISRARVPTDARAFHISITPEGVRALENVHAARRSLIEGAVDGIDEANIVATVEVLSHLAHHLTTATTADA